MRTPAIIYVFADWVGLDTPHLVGELRVQQSRGRETFDFTYDRKWLMSGHAIEIDHHLGLYQGPQFVRQGLKNFGVFQDSSPDRWGRTIMQRREAERARLLSERPTTLLEADFLLGVHDLSRIGGLRFKLDLDGAFLDDATEIASPPWTSLRQLEHVSQEYERTDLRDVEQRHLLALLAPGSSLGGARPKGSVVDEGGALWIAKFPSVHDDRDVAAWEYLSYQLATMCNINVPETRLEVFGSKHHTLLSKRFDRINGDQRIHMSSAMTMLGKVDGDGHDTSVSYLDISDVIVHRSDSVGQELEELWRRILFNVLISNTDDHLRNHAFLLQNGSWALSPMYDVNPAPFGSGLHLNISETDNALDVDLVLSVASRFRIEQDRARSILTEMVSVVRSWGDEAIKIGISRNERERMSSAFVHNQTS